MIKQLKSIPNLKPGDRFDMGKEAVVVSIDHNRGRWVWAWARQPEQTVTQRIRPYQVNVYVKGDRQ